MNIYSRTVTTRALALHVLGDLIWIGVFFWAAFTTNVTWIAISGLIVLGDQVRDARDELLDATRGDGFSEARRNPRRRARRAASR